MIPFTSFCNTNCWGMKDIVLPPLPNRIIPLNILSNCKTQVDPKNDKVNYQTQTLFLLYC